MIVKISAPIGNKKRLYLQVLLMQSQQRHLNGMITSSYFFIMGFPLKPLILRNVEHYGWNQPLIKLSIMFCLEIIMIEFLLDAWKTTRLMTSFFNFMQDLQVGISQVIQWLTKSSRKDTIGLPYSRMLMHMSEYVSLAKSALAKSWNMPSLCSQ